MLLHYWKRQCWTKLFLLHNCKKCLQSCTMFPFLHPDVPFFIMIQILRHVTYNTILLWLDSLLGILDSLKLITTYQPTNRPTDIAIFRAAKNERQCSECEFMANEEQTLHVHLGRNHAYLYSSFIQHLLYIHKFINSD